VSEDSQDPREWPHHPRLRTELFGHKKAEALLLRLYGSGRMHHAWLFSGSRGIGKATLAYRFARFVLAYSDPSSTRERTSLFIPPEAPVAHRVASRGHSDLFVVERAFDPKTERIKSEIAVADIRRAGDFFSHTAGEGGYRICIIDAADDLNTESANALLKVLEEPPARSLFILVNHQAGRILPTIRSRCLRLDLDPLTEEETVSVLAAIDGHKRDDLARAASLSAGSPGRALELLDSNGAKLFASFRDAVARTGRLDHAIRFSIADGFSGRDTADDFGIFCELLLAWAGRQAKSFAGDRRGPEYARIYEEIGHSIRQANALNLDRRQAVMDALTVIGEAATAA
jgi:DNA polymerase III subunit delta'